LHKSLWNDISLGEVDILDITGLKKSYRSPNGETQTALEVHGFAIPAGSHVALRGQSGSGKTTLLNLIAGILVPDKGSIRIDGTEITTLSEGARDRFRARTLGYVFQTFNLLQGYTALENVLLGMKFGSRLDKAFATHLLERVGLKDRIHYRPAQLSVGQQQRVAVARALANRPRLVLADEPTGNLDHTRAQEAISLIREICAESRAALLVVSHDRQILAAFDRVADLEHMKDPRRSGDDRLPLEAQGASI
jgi:putative ABC transport system ATP-binding protein